MKEKEREGGERRKRKGERKEKRKRKRLSSLAFPIKPRESIHLYEYESWMHIEGWHYFSDESN